MILVKMELLTGKKKSGLVEPCEGDRGKISWRIQAGWLSYSAAIQET